MHQAPSRKATQLKIKAVFLLACFTPLACTDGRIADDRAINDRIEQVGDGILITDVPADIAAQTGINRYLLKPGEDGYGTQLWMLDSDNSAVASAIFYPERIKIQRWVPQTDQELDSAEFRDVSPQPADEQAVPHVVQEIYVDGQLRAVADMTQHPIDPSTSRLVLNTGSSETAIDVPTRNIFAMMTHPQLATELGRVGVTEHGALQIYQKVLTDPIWQESGGPTEIAEIEAIPVYCASCSAGGGGYSSYSPASYGAYAPAPAYGGGYSSSGYGGGYSSGGGGILGGNGFRTGLVFSLAGAGIGLLLAGKGSRLKGLLIGGALGLAGGLFFNFARNGGLSGLFGGGYY